MCAASRCAGFADEVVLLSQYVHGVAVIRGSTRQYGRITSSSHDRRLLGSLGDLVGTGRGAAGLRRVPGRAVGHLFSLPCVPTRDPRVVLHRTQLPLQGETEAGDLAEEGAEGQQEDQAEGYHRRVGEVQLAASLLGVSPPVERRSHTS